MAAFQTLAATDIALAIAAAPEAMAIGDVYATIRWETTRLAAGVVRYALDGLWEATAGHGGSATEHEVTLTGLQRGREYHYTVESWTPGGLPVSSETVIFTTLEEPDESPPLAPTRVGIAVVDDDIQINWDAVEADDLAGYDVLRSCDGGPFQVVAARIDELFYIDRGDASVGACAYIVLAHDRAGNTSLPSAVAVALEREAGGPLTAPVPVFSQVAAAALGTVLAVENLPGGVATTYSFEVALDPLFRWPVAQAAGVASGAVATTAGVTAWIVDVELTSGRLYYWRASGSDGQAEGSLGNALPFTTFTLTPGDFNGDFRVDFDDFFRFADAFGASNGEAAYGAVMDLDGNDRLSFDDFFVFSDVFGVHYRDEITTVP